MKRVILMLVALVLVIGIIVSLQMQSRRLNDNTVIVLSGGSMRAVMTEIIERYKSVSDDVIKASYGGSGVLCAQIQNTGKGDIYVCHDPFMPWAEKQGLISEWDAVGMLDVVIITAKGNPRNIQKIEDFAMPDLRLGLGNRQYSSSGVIAYHMLEKLENFEEIQKNVRMETKGHQQRCTDVVMGALDASLVWQAVAHLFRDKLEIIPVPKDHIDAITTATYGESDLKNVKVTVGIIAGARDKEATRKFYEFVTKECRDIFPKFGFRAVPDDLEGTSSGDQ